MKVNYVSTHISKRVMLNKKNTKKANYGKRVTVDSFADIEDITSIANLLLSYCHAEVNGGLLVDDCSRVREDFERDVDMAKETFEEEINRLEVRGISLDVRDIKYALFE